MPLNVVMMIKRNVSLVVYTISHFCVDFACLFMLFRWLSGNLTAMQPVALGFLVYNILAFGMQPIIGYWCDTHQKIPISAIGCALSIAGLGVMAFPWVALILMGFGNACFHVGGGIDSIQNANGKIARSGLFVSSGALGVGLGMLAGKGGLVSAFVPMLLLGLSLVFIIAFCSREENHAAAAQHAIARPACPDMAILALSFLSIVLRSYVGSTIPMEWKTTSFLALLPSIGACVGKASGGFLADWLGARKVGVLSLLFALPCIAFGNGIPAICVVGVVFFNMSMSITLCAIASTLPANSGLVFGITTLALLCGNIPTYFVSIPAAPALIAALTAISAACVYFATSNTNLYEERNHYETIHQKI